MHACDLSIWIRLEEQETDQATDSRLNPGQSGLEKVAHFPESQF